MKTAARQRLTVRRITTYAGVVLISVALAWWAGRMSVLQDKAEPWLFAVGAFTVMFLLEFAFHVVQEIVAGPSDVDVARLKTLYEQVWAPVSSSMQTVLIKFDRIHFITVIQ